MRPLYPRSRRKASAEYWVAIVPWLRVSSSLEVRFAMLQLNLAMPLLLYSVRDRWVVDVRAKYSDHVDKAGRLHA